MTKLLCIGISHDGVQVCMRGFVLQGLTVECCKLLDSCKVGQGLMFRIAGGMVVTRG